MPDAYDRWIYNKPLIVKDSVFAGSTCCMVCLDLKNGNEKWLSRMPNLSIMDYAKTSDGFFQLQGLVYYNGTIFTCGMLTAAYTLDSKTGKVLHRETGDERWRMCTRMTVRDSLCYVGDSQGCLHCFDLQNRKHLWQKNISVDWLTSAAVEFMGGFLFGTSDGLGRYSWKNARKLAHYQFGPDLMPVVPRHLKKTSCMGVPAVFGEDIWVGSGDGYLTHLVGKNLQPVERINLRDPIIGPILHDGESSLYVTTFSGNLYRVKAPLYSK